tara:strand:- start:226 stop:510 length:285 start_codon:yes stop_codon:yes gene_type:complete
MKQNNIKCSLDETLTDMKTTKHTEVLDLIIGKKGTTNREDFEWDIAKDKIEQYANERVIQEMDEFKLWLYKNYPNKFIDIDITLFYKLFKKLKQ